MCRTEVAYSFRFYHAKFMVIREMYLMYVFVIFKSNFLPMFFLIFETLPNVKLRQIINCDIKTRRVHVALPSLYLP